MALTRSKHWATRAYNDFLTETANTPFEWGKHDCALFAANGIQAMTGTDVADDFRGKYSTEKEAFALIETVTGVRGGTVADAAAHCANKHEMAELKNPLMAQRGDLVVLEDSGRLIAGLVHLNGRDIAVAGETKLKKLPIADVKRAWHV